MANKDFIDLTKQEWEEMLDFQPPTIQEILDQNEIKIIKDYTLLLNQIQKSGKKYILYSWDFDTVEKALIYIDKIIEKLTGRVVLYGIGQSKQAAQGKLLKDMGLFDFEIEVYTAEALLSSQKGPSGKNKRTVTKFPVAPSPGNQLGTNGKDIIESFVQNKDNVMNAMKTASAHAIIQWRIDQVQRWYNQHGQEFETVYTNLQSSLSNPVTNQNLKAGKEDSKASIIYSNYSNFKGGCKTITRVMPIIFGGTETRVKEFGHLPSSEGTFFQQGQHYRKLERHKGRGKKLYDSETGTYRTYHVYAIREIEGQLYVTALGAKNRGHAQEAILQAAARLRPEGGEEEVVGTKYLDKSYINFDHAMILASGNTKFYKGGDINFLINGKYYIIQSKFYNASTKSTQQAGIEINTLINLYNKINKIIDDSLSLQSKSSIKNFNNAILDNNVLKELNDLLNKVVSGMDSEVTEEVIKSSRQHIATSWGWNTYKNN